MTSLSRVRVEWSGFPGAPGISTFYTLDPVTMCGNLGSFFNAVKAWLPSDVVVTVIGAGDIIDAANGDLTGSWVGGTTLAQSGVDSGVYSAPAGAVCNWLTAVVADSHRVKGRTFIVPLAGSAFDNTGSISAEVLTGLREAAATLATDASPNFMVWHRPFPGSPAVGTRPARPEHVGSAVNVVSSAVPDKSVVLRSRRD